MSKQHQYQEDLLTEVLTDEHKEILLFNDNVNTFQHVITMLCKYCEHDTLQAEQCAWIVHYNGRCMVKKGDVHKLKPVCQALIDAGLTARIH